MSAETPVLADRRPAEAVASPEPSAPAVERDPEAGAWPESMPEIGFYADTALTIPGQSAPPGECGTWGPRDFCDCCGDVVIGPRRCQRRVCEDCWLTWRGNRSVAVARRLAGARQDADGAHKRLSHIVASPPPGEVRTLVDWEQAKKEAYALAKEKGVTGGVLIPHGWRVKEETKEQYRREKGAGEVEGGIWRWMRERGPSWRSQTYWSPHYHILGMGADLGASDPDNDNGWVFSRIDSFDRFQISDPDTYAPMLRAASYLLSHCGFEPDEGKQVVRWFGDLAPNQFSLEADLKDWERKVIERTVADLAEQPVDGDGDGSKTCPDEDCEGTLSPIWSAGAALCDPGWVDRIGREKEHRLNVAFEWAIGERRPPPGMKYPQTREQAEEAFETLL